MKLKNILIPMVGTASIAGIMPLTVSCSKIYDKLIDLQKFVQDRAKFKRATTYYDGSLTENNVTQTYIDAINNDKYVFIEDLFETIATSTLWDNASNEIKGSLKIDFEKATHNEYYDLIWASVDMDNVVLSLGDASKPIHRIGFNGKIEISSVPFNIWYDADGRYSKWRGGIDVDSLYVNPNWKLTLNGIVTLNEYEPTSFNFTYDHENWLQHPIIDIAISVFLELAHFDIPYFKNATKE